MKDFMEEQLWLAPWHFFILVLNRGQLKNHPVVCVVLHSCELQRQFVAPIALAAEILAAKRFGSAASFAWTHFGSFNPTYFG